MTKKAKQQHKFEGMCVKCLKMISLGKNGYVKHQCKAKQQREDFESVLEEPGKSMKNNSKSQKASKTGFSICACGKEVSPELQAQIGRVKSKMWGVYGCGGGLFGLFNTKNKAKDALEAFWNLPNGYIKAVEVTETSERKYYLIRIQFKVIS